MNTVKELLAKWATPLLVKWVLRGLTYGTAAISAKLAIDVPNQESQQALAGWVVAGVSAGLGMTIDYFQSKWQDRQPAKK